MAFSDWFRTWLYPLKHDVADPVHVPGPVVCQGYIHLVSSNQGSAEETLQALAIPRSTAVPLK